MPEGLYRSRKTVVKNLNYPSSGFEDGFLYLFFRFADEGGYKRFAAPCGFFPAGFEPGEVFGGVAPAYDRRLGVDVFEKQDVPECGVVFSIDCYSDG